MLFEMGWELGVVAVVVAVGNATRVLYLEPRLLSENDRMSRRRMLSCSTHPRTARRIRIPYTPNSVSSIPQDCWHQGWPGCRRPDPSHSAAHTPLLARAR